MALFMAVKEGVLSRCGGLTRKAPMAPPLWSGSGSAQQSSRQHPLTPDQTSHKTPHVILQFQPIVGQVATRMGVNDLAPLISMVSRGQP